MVARSLDRPDRRTYALARAKRWFEAEVNRIAGEITLNSPEHDALQAERYFERALSVARQQQAKSWETPRLDKPYTPMAGPRQAQQARELLAPIYDWFTEGFNTHDLTEANALLEELAS